MTNVDDASESIWVLLQDIKENYSCKVEKINNQDNNNDGQMDYEETKNSYSIIINLASLIESEISDNSGGISAILLKNIICNEINNYFCVFICYLSY